MIVKSANKDSIKQIEDVIFQYTGYHLENPKSRIRELTITRQLMAYFLKTHTAMTFEAIGNVIGKDHATIIKSVSVVKGLIETDWNIITRSKGFTDIFKDLDSKVKFILSMQKSYQTDFPGKGIDQLKARESASNDYLFVKIKELKDLQLKFHKSVKEIDSLKEENQALNNHIRLLRDKIKRMEHPYYPITATL